MGASAACWGASSHAPSEQESTDACSGKIGRPKANGAGIAADPTVTDAWPSSFNTRFKGRRLGIRCFPFWPSEDGHPVLSPALAPASGATLRSARFCRVTNRSSLACMAQPRFNGRFRSLAFRWWREAQTVTSPSGPKTFIRRHLRPSCRVGLAHIEKPSHFRHRPALRPAKAFGTRVSKSTRTDPAASSRLRNFLSLLGR